MCVGTTSRSLSLSLFYTLSGFCLKFFAVCVDVYFWYDRYYLCMFCFFFFCWFSFCTVAFVLFCCCCFYSNSYFSSGSLGFVCEFHSIFLFCIQIFFFQNIFNACCYYLKLWDFRKKINEARIFLIEAILFKFRKLSV